MNFETIKHEKIDGIAKMTINRPDNFNTLNNEMSYELFKIAIEFDEDKNIRTIIVTGFGRKSFCAGETYSLFKTKLNY